MLVLIDDELRYVLDKAAHEISNTTQLMTDISRVLLSETMLNFRLGGRPTWAGLYAGGRATLQKSGRLRQSVSVNSTATTASIGSNLAYAAIHQFGGTTRPHVICPKRARALKTPYGLFKKVNHPGSKIPARPFVPVDASGNLHPDTALSIGGVVQDYLRGAFI